MCAITVTHTLCLPVEAVHTAFADANARGHWLGDLDLRLRPADAPGTVRLDRAGDGSRVTVKLDGHGADRTTVRLEHDGLPHDAAAAAALALWRTRLGAG